jgi:hypothetical protein
MSKQTSFIGQVRQYANAQRRLKKGYGTQVNHLLQQFKQVVEADFIDPLQKANLIVWAENFVQREYGAEDRDFKIDEG